MGVGVRVRDHDRRRVAGGGERRRGGLDVAGLADDDAGLGRRRVGDRLRGGGLRREGRRVDRGALLGEELLQLGDGEALRLAPDALRRRRRFLGRAGERRERLRALLRRAVARQRLEEVRDLGGRRAVRVARHRLRAPRLGALRGRLAAGVARLQLRAEARRVPHLVAVAALVLQELGAAHLAALAGLVLHEVAGEGALGEPLRLAEAAEFGVVLVHRRLLAVGSH